MKIKKRGKKTLGVVLAALLGIGVLCPVGVARLHAEEAAPTLTVTDGLYVHVDATAVTGLNDGAAVARLSNDGAGGALVQNQTARQPKWVGGGTLGGRAALRFQADSYLTVENSSDKYLENMTIFVVANPSALPAHGELLSRVINRDSYNHNWFFNIENGQLNYGWSSNGSYPKTNAALNKDTTYILSAQRDGTRGTLKVNGVASPFSGGTPSNPTTPITLGGDVDSFIGDIGEVLLYDRALSSAETTAVERYLESKWGLDNIHEALLTGISVKGAPLKEFRADQKNYYILSDETLSTADITVEPWNASDSVTVTETENGFAIEVTGAKTQRKNTYKLEVKSMQYAFNEIEKYSANEVKINDGFWSGLYRQYSVHTVNYMFDMFDLSNSFDNFDRVAKGEKKVLGNTSEHAAQIRKPINDKDVYNTGWEWISEPWREGLIYEGIRAAGQFVSVNRADPSYAKETAALVARVDDYIDRIYAAALKTTARDGNGKPIDGYFSTFNILDQRFVADESEVSGRYHHDIYNYGCLTEAATYWYAATGDTRLLFAATRFTEFLIDYINGRDGYQGYKVVPPHQLPEEALQKLYDLYQGDPALVRLMQDRYSYVDGLDPDDRYYKLEIRLDEYAKIAASWITDRGNSEGRYNDTNYGAYAQDNVIYDEMTDAVGHAVRANLWYNGIAYIGNRRQNKDFVAAAERIWRNIVGTQMYVTGGTGSTHDGDEAYGGSNQLPHDGYCETCASVGMAFFSQNMFYLMGGAEYADAVELEMYNGILGCLGLDGNSFYYTNPMVSDNYQRPMFSNATPCCVPMFLKFYAELPELIYAHTADTVFVNQYIASSLQTGSIGIIQATDMPNGNRASLTARGNFTLKLRVPSWANGAQLSINGQSAAATVGADGYIDVAIDGSAKIDVVFVKEVLRVKQDYAEANVGKIAIRYGSFVYCAEADDNESRILNSADLFISANAATQIEYTETMFAYKQDGIHDVPLGVNVLSIQAAADRNAVTLKLIPFYLRGNRSHGKMVVWFNER